MTPLPPPRRVPRAGGRNVHWGLILLFIIVAVITQYQWRQHIKKRGPESIAPNSLAEKLSVWMFKKRGLLPADMEETGHPGVEAIQCSACSGMGVTVSDGGELEPCGICFGVGSRMVRRYSAEDYQCVACAGMGRLRLPGESEILTCPRCGGRGLILSHPGEARAE